MFLCVCAHAWVYVDYKSWAEVKHFSFFLSLANVHLPPVHQTHNESFEIRVE